MTSEQHLAFIALGSNIQPETNLVQAVVSLKDSGTVLSVSQVWESSPVGDTNQANFLNAAVLLNTSHCWKTLREELLPTIEQRLHRVRDPENKNAARTIDLDLVLYDDLICEQDGWQVPDPEIATRPFLALPLAELMPEYRHPVEQKTLQELAAAFDNVLQTHGMFLRKDLKLSEGNDR